jgi:hypothetical protein
MTSAFHHIDARRGLGVETEIMRHGAP